MKHAEAQGGPIVVSKTQCKEERNTLIRPTLVSSWLWYYQWWTSISSYLV